MNGRSASSRVSLEACCLAGVHGQLKVMVRIAVILPCHNEELTIAETIAGFVRNLPDAEIWVCDNRSTDRTAAVALENGADVIHERSAGKETPCAACFPMWTRCLCDGGRRHDL